MLTGAWQSAGELRRRVGCFGGARLQGVPHPLGFVDIFGIIVSRSLQGIGSYTDGAVCPAVRQARQK